MKFIFERPVHVYETDLMGVVHHSNYLRYCEEARVNWFSKNGYGTLTTAEIYGLVVYETRVQHKNPIRYGDFVRIDLQMKIVAARLTIQYVLRNDLSVFAKVETIHCQTDQNFKVQRLEKKLLKIVEKEKWTETWL